MEKEIINFLEKKGAMNKANALTFPMEYTKALHFYDEKLGDTMFITKLWCDAEKGLMATYQAQNGSMARDMELNNNPCLSYDEIMLFLGI